MNSTGSTSSESSLPRVVIVGAATTGLLLASMLQDVPAEVVVLDQVSWPRPAAGFPGILDDSDLQKMGLSPDSVQALPVADVMRAELPDNPAWHHQSPHQWWVVEHRAVLEHLARTAVAAGAALEAGAVVTDLLFQNGQVAGVRCAEDGIDLAADLVILADESDPRLAEKLDLRPDWSPLEIMHLGKEYFEAPANVIQDRFRLANGQYQMHSFRFRASWGTPGFGTIIPSRTAIAMTAAILLEDEMVSARHVREVLDEMKRHPLIRDLLSGLTGSGFFTEVVPVGGFDARPTFHMDHVLVMSDLVGITNPLNHEGLSSNLRMCEAAAATVREAVAAGTFSGTQLAGFSKRIADGIIEPVDETRRREKGLRVRPPWQWVAKPELVPARQGVTSAAKSANLRNVSDAGRWHRLRTLGRLPGIRKQVPGQYDE